MIKIKFITTSKNGPLVVLGLSEMKYSRIKRR